MSSRISGWLKRLRKPAKAAPGKAVEPYRAVAIVGGLDGCCERARRLAGRRFLMTDPPPLPLPGCDFAKCTCKYVRFDDRRMGPRRSEEAGITNTFVRTEERREEGSGRRSTD